MASKNKSTFKTVSKHVFFAVEMFAIGSAVWFAPGNSALAHSMMLWAIIAHLYRREIEMGGY